MGLNYKFYTKIFFIVHMKFKLNWRVLYFYL